MDFLKKYLWGQSLGLLEELWEKSFLSNMRMNALGLFKEIRGYLFDLSKSSLEMVTLDYFTF
jgi:hypothetical protein